MANNLTVNKVRELGQQIMDILSTEAHPVGVQFVSNGSFPPEAERLQSHRYCQALMQARSGKEVILEGDQLSCPAAASAFGFHPLPGNLKNGKGLVGYGIVSEETIGQRMFEGMTRMPAGKVEFIHLAPLDQVDYRPDVIIMEDEIEKLMWISLAALHANRGERIKSSTAVLQATCVDCTIIPFVEQKINLSYGCYGCREATNLNTNEAALGFPMKMLSGIVEHLNFLNKQAIPRSREKRPYLTLKQRIYKLN